MKSVISSTRAEMARLRKWPAVWVTFGAWLLLSLLFGYVFNYVAYKNGETSFSTEGQSAGDLLAEVLPSGLPSVLQQGVPMFGAAIMLVLGGLIAGSGFSWGTWKTAFTQGPGKLAVIGGSIGALGVLTALFVAAQFVLSLGTSMTLALVEGVDIVMPPAADLAIAVGSAALIMFVYGLLGFAIGLLARGPALAVGLGLVWVLVVENLLRGVGGTLAVIDSFAKVLPGTASGSLVGAHIGTGGAPGLLDTLSATASVWMLVAYGAAAVIGSVVLTRRDVS